MSKDWTFNLTKFYYTLVSFAGIVWMTIAFGVVLYNIIASNVISDEEYMDGWWWSWEIQQCSDPYYNFRPLPWAENEVPTAKTLEEIETCEAKAKERVKNQRRYQKKTSTLAGLIRWIIFWFLYFTHYPKMRWETVPVLPSKAPAKRKAPVKRTSSKAKTTRKKTTKKTAKK